MTYRCDYCTSDCNSWSEYTACMERCEADDANTRAYFKRDNPNHRGI